MNIDTKKSGFKFTNPKLLSSIFIINEAYSKKIQDLQNLTLGTKIGKKSDEASVELIVSTSEKIDLNEDTPFYLSVSMKANFSWKDAGFDDNEVENLLNINAPALLLSYIRAHIAILTEQSEIPTIHIPFIDFTKHTSHKN